MSQTSSKNALMSSRPKQVGEIPYWVETWDEVVVWDTNRQTAVCRKCHGEVKNLSWVNNHARDCFGIEV